MKMIACVSLIALLTLSACSSPRSVVDYDTSRNFATLNSYRWASAEETLASNAKAGQRQSSTSDEAGEPVIENGNNSLPNPDLLSKRIKRAISEHLAQKNIQHNMAAPDFLIAYQLTAQTNIFYDNYYYSPFDVYLGGCSRHSHFCTGGVWRGDVREYKYTELFLVLRFMDPHNKDTLWQGIVEVPLNSSKRSAQEYDQLVAERVAIVLKRFPPQKSSQ